MTSFTLEQRAEEIRAKIAAGVCVPPPEFLRRAPEALRTDGKGALLDTLDRLAEQQGRPKPLEPPGAGRTGLRR